MAVSHDHVYIPELMFLRTANPTAFLRSFASGTLAASRRNVARAPQFNARIVVPRRTQRSLPLILTATVAGAALGISSLASPTTLHCDGKCYLDGPLPRTLSVYFKT